MDVRYPKMHEDILALPVGESVVYRALDGRTIKQMLGDVCYFFTGHVETTDQRLGAPGCEHVSLDWDWRIEYTWEHDPNSRALWNLILTKVLSKG